MRPLFALSSLAILTAGCRPPPTVYPPAATRYYAVEFETTRATETGALPRQSDVLAKDAPKLLKPGTTVAFLPPDSCATETIAPSGAEEASTSILMKCGALLASLEAEVAKAGYSVVSWQALKTSGAGASQERARSLDVDILFEVNQLSQESRDPGARQLSNMTFAQMETPAQRTAASVTRDVAGRCAQLLPGLPQRLEKEFTSTVNLKAVDVKSGRALWLYQNSVVEHVGEDGRATQMLYFRAEGKRPDPPAPKMSGMTIAGGVLMGAGLTSIYVGGLVYLIASEDSKDEASTALKLGALATAAGITMLVMGRPKKGPEGPIPEATYPAAGEVLCVGDPIADPWGQRGAASPAVEETSASFSYQQTKSASRDLDRERGRRLAQKITADFVTALKTVARTE